MPPTEQRKEVWKSEQSNAHCYTSEDRSRFYVMDASDPEEKDPDCIAEVIDCGRHTEGRARLLAAAPDLLAACQEALPMLTADGSGHIGLADSLAHCDRIAAIVRAAIEKAMKDQ